MDAENAKQKIHLQSIINTMPEFVSENRKQSNYGTLFIYHGKMFSPVIWWNDCSIQFSSVFSTKYLTTYLFGEYCKTNSVIFYIQNIL